MGPCLTWRRIPVTWIFSECGNDRKWNYIFNLISSFLKQIHHHRAKSFGKSWILNYQSLAPCWIPCLQCHCCPWPQDVDIYISICTCHITPCTIINPILLTYSTYYHISAGNSRKAHSEDPQSLQCQRQLVCVVGKYKITSLIRFCSISRLSKCWYSRIWAQACDLCLNLCS